MRALLLIIMTTLVLAMAPSVASAATVSCPNNPEIALNINPTAPVVGDTLTYSYSFCYNTDADYYTTTLLEQQTDGSYLQVSAPLTQSLPTGSGNISANSSYQLTESGQYQLSVNYYSQGSTAADTAQITFSVSPAAPISPVVPPTPTSPTTPLLPPSATTPAASPPALPPVSITDTPEAPPSAPTISPVGSLNQHTRLTIHEQTRTQRYHQGQMITWSVVISNPTSITADKLIICDRLRGTQFVTASRAASFTSNQVCLHVKKLAGRASSTVQLRLLIGRHTSLGQLANQMSVRATNAHRVTTTRQIHISALKSAAPTTIPRTS